MVTVQLGTRSDHPHHGLHNPPVNSWAEGVGQGRGKTNSGNESSKATLTMGGYRERQTEGCQPYPYQSIEFSTETLQWALKKLAHKLMSHGKLEAQKGTGDD